MKLSDAASNRKAWGLLLLAASLAAEWVGVNLLTRDLAVGPISLGLVLMLAANVVFLYGLWRSLARTPFSPSMRMTTWLGVTLVLAIWIGTVWTLAANGAFQRAIGKAPTLPLAIFLPMLIGFIVLTRSKGVATLLDATPASWLIGIQLYRIVGGMFLVYWIRDAVPGEFALPAGIGDVATGVFALPAALWVASGSAIGQKIGIRWNVLGLVDFAVAVTMGMLTSPGPAHLLAHEHPNTLIATFPTAMVPAFAVPFSTLMHVLSLRQLQRLQNPTTIPGAKQVATGSQLVLN